MTTPTRLGLRTGLAALLALGSLWSTAEAQPTPAGVTIQNRASVNYSVGGVPQTVIESSPTGNTTPGTNQGAYTQFVVDQLVDLTVGEVSGNATIASPGEAGAWLAFSVTNTGNAPQGYQLSVAEEVGTSLFTNTDTTNVGLGNLVVRVDDGNGTYDGTETAAAIDTLAPGASITVFVVAQVPLTLVNGDFANVRLEAVAAVAGTNGVTLEVETPGANDPTTVEIIFGDSGNDATESAADQYAIQSAALTVTKASAVIDDGISTSNFRAIPGAVVEYTITVANTGTTGADSIAISDVIPPSTTFLADLQYTTGDVEIVAGGGPATYCVAETPTDTNLDGCYTDGTQLIVGTAALGSVPATSSTIVRFRVQID